MVNREEVEAEVRDGVEVLETGRWYIAEGSYDGRESVAQGETRREAIDNLISRFYSRVKQEEEMEAERERIEEEMEQRRELSDRRMERAIEEAEQEFNQVKERFEE